MDRTEPALVDHAPAKVNLTLRVHGRRADGYHELESLVVFASVRDRLTFAPGADLGLVVDGPSAAASGAIDDNLVLKAARALAQEIPGLRLGRFVLEKVLPVAAGVGGGSSDAAAALRLLARANGLALNDARLFAAGRKIGADVPVCIDPRPRIMRGVGEMLSEPLRLPELPAVLVNPGVAVPTKDVFVRLNAQPWNGVTTKPIVPPEPAALLAFLESEPNDLEPPAVALQPVIAEVLAALRQAADCRLARMSGSGATCFGLFDSPAAAAAAARQLQAAQPGWWVRDTVLG